MGWSLQSIASLTDSQFVQWSKLLEERTGIQLADQHRAMLQSQVSIRMRELGCTDYNQYFRAVTDGVQGRLEWTVLVDRLAVKETSFFRHRPSFELVRQYLARRLAQGTVADNLDLWSMGCATGEEPYSLAMMADTCFEQAQAERYYGITATDISMSALSTGRRGCYSARKIESLSDAERERYVHEVEPGVYQVDVSLRERICFTHGNLMAIQTMPPVKQDVIFCQNLLIYFRRWLRRDILNACVERLKPGGLLVVGLGEAPGWEHPKVRRVKAGQVQAYLRHDQQEQ
ncbi:CheR family methyltransferase [Marinimicrobium alkaliphilum]|uniref:CheR family methyltransferase n=1 Tax=Marinimicrobium alkaliphilum TaxID=2202654 RepID=UPI000DBA2A24|nr:CheR family methyltransferase [Marinimicrobium alkaliphilum]